MSDFKVTPEVELTMTQLLERYHLKDERILHLWAQVHGINSSRGVFYPTEVDLLDHAHHHIQNLGMSVGEYESLIDRSRKPVAPPSVTRAPVAPTPVAPTPVAPTAVAPTPVAATPITNNEPVSASEVTEDAYAAIEMLTQQYSEAIDVMGERIAEQFIDELDLSVMRHLAKKVRDRRQQLTAQNPNRFVQMIQAAFKPANPLLTPKKSQDSSLELEHNHRLG
jgi:hypothetical protein